MSTETPDAKSAAGAEAAAPPKAANPWLPMLAMTVLMPVISYAMITLVLLPKFQAVVQPSTGENIAHRATPASPRHATPANPHSATPSSPHSANPANEEGEFSYDFENLVVNLAGSMGTRYLKTSFTIYSNNPDLKKVVDERKKKLLDVAIGVLGSRSLADLELAGAKNILRNDLIANFNAALKSELINQLYFSEFVLQ